jgi:hypothetical protein
VPASRLVILSKKKSKESYKLQPPHQGDLFVLLIFKQIQLQASRKTSTVRAKQNSFRSLFSVICCHTRLLYRTEALSCFSVLLQVLGHHPPAADFFVIALSNRRPNFQHPRVYPPISKLYAVWKKGNSFEFLHPCLPTCWPYCIVLSLVHNASYRLDSVPGWLAVGCRI